jgi:hypothetical protein
MKNIQKWWLGVRVKIGKWVVFAVAPNIKAAETRLAEIDAEEERRADEIFEQLKERAMREERLQRRILKHYITWKAILLKEMIATIGACEKCHRTDMPFSVDHIIPVFLLKSFGVDFENLRDRRYYGLLCRPCNFRKGHSLDFEDPRTKPLLVELLATVKGAEKWEEIGKLPSQLDGAPSWAIQRWYRRMQAKENR